MGYVISVVNNKGGVGKTTTTCNLSDSLGKQGKKVLVVDADPQSNTTTMLLPRDTQIQKGFYDLLENDSNPTFTSGHIYGTACKNVFILPNINETASLEPTLIAQAPNSFMRLRTSLRGNLLNNFDFIMIDCPPNMGTFVLCALYASDFAIVPILARSTFSVQGLIKAVALIKDIKEAGNPNLRFLRLLVNSVDKRTSISKSITEQVHRVFDSDQIFKTQIPVNTAFEQAEANRSTIFQHDGTSTGARAYRELAKELSSIVGA
jgi:cellulose biosynthesis protein BcsQ